MSTGAEQAMEVDPNGAMTEVIDFRGIDVDMRTVREVGITREVVKKLLERDQNLYGKHNDQHILVLVNFNAKKVGDTKLKINHDEIRTILTSDEFKLCRLKSDDDDPYTNPRGGYLAHITGDRDVQCEKIKKLHRKIKERLVPNPKLNISKAHVVASLVLYYGEDEDPSQATPTSHQTHMTDYFNTPGGASLSATPSDQGYASQHIPLDKYLKLCYRTVQCVCVCVCVFNKILQYTKASTYLLFHM